jgi:hypothetical protein
MAAALLGTAAVAFPAGFRAAGGTFFRKHVGSILRPGKTADAFENFMKAGSFFEHVRGVRKRRPARLGGLIETASVDLLPGA